MSTTEISPDAPALEQAFKDALSCWATGVSVVTTKAGDMLYGLTVSSFTSVSLRPPIVLVCLNVENRMSEMIREAGAFAVSILGREQEEASNYFATPGREPTAGFVKIDGDWSESGQPVVKDADAYVCCELEAMQTHGDHHVVYGRVVEARSKQDATPLLYFSRGYHGLD